MLLVASLPVAAETLKPDQVDGLTAWYDLGPVHRRAREGMQIARWPDSSGNGHDLVSAREDAPVFRTKAVNGMPAISVRRANRLDVTDPFELGDHTIFLVYDTKLSKRALFSSDIDDNLGLVVADKGQFHYLQNGKNGGFRYNRLGSPAKGFRIATLGRERGSLRSFVNGVDLSSGLPIATPLRVSRLFELRHTRFVVSDGDGMSIAEMIFFDRYLSAAEQLGILQYLSDKYSLPLEDNPVAGTEQRAENEVGEIDSARVRVHASNRTDLVVNDEIVAIPWDFIARSDEPFHFGSGNENTRVYCRADGARLRVTATLPLHSKVVDAQLRLLLQVNRADYLEEDAVSDPFQGQGVAKSSQVRLQTELTMNEGDFFEVISTREATPGLMRVLASEALLIVEWIE